MKYFLQLFILLFLIEGCNSQPGTKTKEAAPVAAEATKPVIIDTTTAKADPLLHQYARFLAGMPTTGNAVPAKLQNNAFYKKYEVEMDTNFHKIEVNRLSKMRDWGNVELATEHAQPGVLFYPFSGPDILHAITFYPNATQYVMIAMERPGTIPNIGKMDSAQAAYYLNSVYQSLQDIFEKSYFITHKMIQDLQKVKVNGVAPIICLFLERTGHEVVSFQKKHLNDNGTVSELPADSLPTHLNDFIEISVRTPGSDTLRKITYFRANLGDQTFENLPALKNNKPFLNYINSLPDFYMYTKSASYLMNYASFSAVRDVCLTKSKSILQDDTGIGYKYFDKKTWHVKLYGHYVTPVRDFKGVYDSVLAEAYKTDSVNVKHLSFSLGYHWGNQSNQNLMKAERVSGKP
ncbi:MAG TPA: hypothetical protein VG603_03090 [Chitinophagales bacterium]|nr:hypothetical protein [Chitinophagales bacterium]